LTLHGCMPILLTSVVLSGTYLTIAWTSVKIRNHLKRIASASKNTTRLQQQLSRALLLQAITSWIVSFVPLMLALGVLLFSVEGGSVIAESQTSIIAWIPVLNPTLTMLCISGYRQEAVRFLQGLLRPLMCKGSSPVVELSSVSTIAPAARLQSPT
ncbi:7TM GPCR protein, partial [Aphelenchoides avenae]